MKRAFILLGLAAAAVARGETLAGRLLAAYDGIESVACSVRKDAESGGANVRTLSKVYYQKPDRLHVENAVPLQRTIVSDGTDFYSYIREDPKGFSRPVSELDEEMLIQLRKVPGTAMDHLMHVAEVAEVELPPEREGFERRGYDTGKVFAVLTADDKDRLVRIEFYASVDMKQRYARYDYSEFEEVAPGAWIPLLHEGLFNVGDIETRETTRISNLSVNTPVDPALFVAETYFEGVEFVRTFDEIYR
ncbi:MAG: hypothetical protein JXB04_04750 [Kiritimatiellae bacterium]|nr:hypothetical protein [Kiritimatiellia bacterium]